jgi:hypothetical protein
MKPNRRQKLLSNSEWVYGIWSRTWHATFTAFSSPPLDICRRFVPFVAMLLMWALLIFKLAGLRRKHTKSGLAILAAKDKLALRMAIVMATVSLVSDVSFQLREYHNGSFNYLLGRTFRPYHLIGSPFDASVQDLLYFRERSRIANWYVWINGYAPITYVINFPLLVLMSSSYRAYVMKAFGITTWRTEGSEVAAVKSMDGGDGKGGAVLKTTVSIKVSSGKPPTLTNSYLTADK